MRFRVCLLISLLFLRLVANWWIVTRVGLGKLVRIHGRAIALQQNRSKCIYKIEIFEWEEKGNCKFSQRAEVVVTGKSDGGLIDSLLGRLWLKDPQIIRISELGDGENLWLSYLTRFKLTMVKIVNSRLPSIEAGLVAGIVLGYKAEIGNEFYQQLVTSGTIHMLVASGYNVMVVASVVMAIAMYRWKRPVATAVGLLMIWIYVVIASMNPPVVRAGVMASIVLLGQALGRKVINWWVLMLAVWVMLMIQPEMWLSISFQLSVAATAGMMLVAPVLERNSKFLARFGLAQTVGVLILTAPIIWGYFGRFSWIALWSNLVVLPLVPIVMALGAMMILFGLVWYPLSYLWMLPTYAVAHLIVVLVRFFAVS